MKPDTSLRIWPRDVEGEHQPTLELFPLDTNLAADTVLVLPGGGYRYTSPREADRIAYAFNQQGYQTAVLYYRVAPRRFPEPQQDAIRAIRLLRAHAEEWKLGSRIAVCGFSAGGHLAASCGTIWKEIDADAGDDADRMEARPDALILGYPVITLTGFGHLGSSRSLTGQESETGPAEGRTERRLLAEIQVLLQFPEGLGRKLHSGHPVYSCIDIHSQIYYNSVL